MSDLVERLRDRDEQASWPVSMCKEAADAIERLTAERDRLAAAIINWLDDHRGGGMADANVYAREFRAALQEKRDE